MNISVFQCIQGLVLVLAVNVSGSCRKEHFAQRLGREPDAWRILGNFTQQFFLAYYSKNSDVGSKERCLHTISREQKYMVPWTTSLVYGHTLDNKTLLNGIVVVGVTKINQSFVFDDAFYTTYKQEERKGEYIDKFDTSEIIYTNFVTCMLLYSDLLGYQVWVTGKNPTRNSGLPYLCTFLYEACAGRKKHWAYYWNICPNIKNAEQLTKPPR
uniref:Putative lipocalin lipocalin n=1 Tax=Ixodes ricinus TaxID=34613 RepID=A0A6B0V221_IXORI